MSFAQLKSLKIRRRDKYGQADGTFDGPRAKNQQVFNTKVIPKNKSAC